MKVINIVCTTISIFLLQALHQVDARLGDAVGKTGSFDQHRHTEEYDSAEPELMQQVLSQVRIVLDNNVGIDDLSDDEAAELRHEFVATLREAFGDENSRLLDLAEYGPGNDIAKSSDSDNDSDSDSDHETRKLWFMSRWFFKPSPQASKDDADVDTDTQSSEDSSDSDNGIDWEAIIKALFEAAAATEEPTLAPIRSPTPAPIPSPTPSPTQYPTIHDHKTSKTTTLYDPVCRLCGRDDDLNFGGGRHLASNGDNGEDGDDTVFVSISNLHDFIEMRLCERLKESVLQVFRLVEDCRVTASMD